MRPLCAARRRLCESAGARAGARARSLSLSLSFGMGGYDSMRPAGLASWRLAAVAVAALAREASSSAAAFVSLDYPASTYQTPEVCRHR